MHAQARLRRLHASALRIRSLIFILPVLITIIIEAALHNPQHIPIRPPGIPALRPRRIARELVRDPGRRLRRRDLARLQPAGRLRGLDACGAARAVQAGAHGVPAPGRVLPRAHPGGVQGTAAVSRRPGVGLPVPRAVSHDARPGAVRLGSRRRL